MTTPVAQGTPGPDGKRSAQSTSGAAYATHTDAGFLTTLGLAYVIAFLLIVALVVRADAWSVLANTRLLDVLMRTGIVARTDADIGFILGIPDHNLYLKATEAVDWPMVLAAIGLFVIHWTLKGVQFHGIVRFAGVEGSLGQHLKAYAYGNGICHLLPFNIGAVAQAEALEGQGAPADSAALAVYVSKLFIALEIAIFGLVGLYLIGWTTWLAQLFWSLVLLGIAFLFVRSNTGWPSSHGVRAILQPASEIFSALLRQPLLAAGLVLQSVIAFALVDVIAYIVSQAYTGTYVILNIEPKLLLMGVVGSYFARFIQVTPGGIGQAEWGFAMALYLGGAGFDVAATIALLWGQVRYLSMFLVMAATLVAGVDTNLASVVARFRGIEYHHATAGVRRPQPKTAPAD